VSSTGLVGHRLGRLQVKSRIGHGGFAIVYRAFDEALASDVAVKVLAENHSLEPDIRRRFLDEARLLRRVDHPSLIRVHDVGETSDLQPYLVLEFMAGGTVSDRLAAGRVPNDVDLRQLVDLLASALSALHGHGIIHRDVSLRNILIRSAHGRSMPLDRGRLFHPGEEPVLGDLGLAKDLQEASGFTIGVGTAGYAAPEQQHPGALVGPPADIYAASALMRAVSRGTELETQVRSATAAGLRQDPTHRPGLDEWAAGLRSALEPGSRRSAATSLDSLRRVSPAVAFGGLAVVGAAIVFMVSSLLNPAVSTTIRSTEQVSVVDVEQATDVLDTGTPAAAALNAPEQEAGAERAVQDSPDTGTQAPVLDNESDDGAAEETAAAEAADAADPETADATDEVLGAAGTKQVPPSAPVASATEVPQDDDGTDLADAVVLDGDGDPEAATGAPDNPGVDTAAGVGPESDGGVDPTEIPSEPDPEGTDDNPAEVPEPQLDNEDPIEPDPGAAVDLEPDGGDGPNQVDNDPAVAGAVVAVENGRIAERWDQESWSVRTPLDDSGTIELDQFGALSFIVTDGITVDADSFVVGQLQSTVDFDGLPPQEQAALMLRANDASGEALEPCPLTGSVGLVETKLTTTATGDTLFDISFAVPLRLLQVEGGALTRLSIQNRRNQPTTLTLSRLEIVSATQVSSIAPIERACG